MNYNLTPSSVKINSTNHFKNPELKAFVESYLEEKPNLEIIKITDPNCIKDIERVLDINGDLQESSHAKLRIGRNRSGQPTNQPNSSRLLNALSGTRLSNVTVNRINSPSINATSRRNMYRK